MVRAEIHDATLGPEHLAVIVNEADPLSRRIADYYRQQRNIPDGNVIHVSFRPGDKMMSSREFKQIHQQVVEQTPANVQAYVLTWTVPYRAGCMSITTAFAAGYDPAFCAARCKVTKKSPYFNSDSRRPFDDYGWRPAMMLAGAEFDDVKALIDRGIAADNTHPSGKAYLLSTTDKARNGRSRYYGSAILAQHKRFGIELVKSDKLTDRPDVMFYFTGLAQVKGIETNRYHSGAIADHLTSTGGRLTGGSQMSSLRWLEAGATGSYGTVVEPCAFTQKFPRPDIVIDRYLDGETLLEAYWKSVAWPGQGVFIGEPLAAPFAVPLEMGSE